MLEEESEFLIKTYIIKTVITNNNKPNHTIMSIISKLGFMLEFIVIHSLFFLCYMFCFLFLRIIFYSFSSSLI